MKKASARKKVQAGREGLSSEYRFDYGKSKPNRFAARMASGTIAVVLEPDVAAVFKSSKRVNALLRSLISDAPQAKRKRAS
jgi:hypothetical protein